MEKNGLEGILPCYPSSPMVDLGDDVEYIWINSISLLLGFELNAVIYKLKNN